MKLISAMVAPRPHAVEWLLERVLVDSRYPASLQVEALIGLDTIGRTASMPKGPLIRRVLCGVDVDTTRSMVRLIDWGLLSADELCAAMDYPDAARAATHLSSRLRPTAAQAARLRRAWAAALHRALGGPINDGGRLCCALLERLLAEDPQAIEARWIALLDARIVEAATAAHGDFQAQQQALSLEWMREQISAASTSRQRTHSWPEMFEHLGREGVNGATLVSLLRDAALIDDAALGRSNPTVADKSAAALDVHTLFELLDHRLASIELAPDSRQPPYADAWFTLASVLRPVPKIVGLSQCSERASQAAVALRADGVEPTAEQCLALARAGLAPLGGEQTHWLRFSHDDRAFRYLLHGNPEERLDAVALLAGFNDFLERIAHPQRLYALAPPYTDDSWMFVIAADWRTFWAVRQRLRLPVLGVHSWQ